MKHVILMIVLAVLKESYPLNPEILKYDQYMKDFETTGRQLKREKNEEMNPLIVKREDQKHEDQKLDTTVSQSTKNGEETLLHRCLQTEGFQGKDLEELTAGQRGRVVGCMNKEHVDDFAKNVTGYIATMTPPEAQAAAYDIHGQWFGWGKEMNRDLANVSALYEKETRKCKSYELLLGVRNEFEHELMDTLYPKDFPTTNSAYFKCLFVTHMQIGPMADTYRSIIEESGFSLGEFCLLAGTEVYDPKSEIIQKVQIPRHCLTIENYKAIIRDDEKLMAFIKNGRRREDIISTILKLRQARLEQHGPLGISAFPENSYRCLLLSNVPLKKHSKPRSLPITQIKSFFHSKEARYNIRSICETKESYAEGMFAGKVLVEFSKPANTARALLDHSKTVLDHDVSIKLVNCDDWNCADEMKSPSGTNGQ